METFFTSYTKKIEGNIFYFVKKFIAFPELSNLPPVQDGFGMHTDFDKACAIANLHDEGIKKQLLEGIESGAKQQAKVIGISDAGFNSQRPAVGL